MFMKNILYILLITIIVSCGSSETQDQNLNFKNISEISNESKPIEKSNTDTIGRESNVNALVNTGEVVSEQVEIIEPKPIEQVSEPKQTSKVTKPITKKQPSQKVVDKPFKQPIIQTEDENIVMEEFAPLEVSKFKQKNTVQNNSNNNSSVQQVIGHINATNVSNGSSIIIILKDNLKTDDGIIEAGQRIAAIGYITAGRLNLRFNSVIVNNRIIEIKAKCYDQRDGLEGINIGEQSIKTGGTSGARNAINSVANGVASMVPGLGGRAAQGVTQGVTGSISSKSVNLKLPATDVILITRTNSANNLN